MEDVSKNIYNSIIGRGVLFPIELTTNDAGETGWYPVSGDTKLINNNIEALILYQLGQRFREEDFGTRLWECLEEPNSQAQAFIINEFMKEALSTWEDRISYKSTNITREGSKLLIEFTYIINTTDSSITSKISYDSLSNSISV